MQITALHNQTLLDIAIRHCGTIEAVVDIAVLNNISITDDLVSGQLIALPSKDYGSKEVINYFVTNKIDPANALNDLHFDLVQGKEGIGFWSINNNFITQ